MAVGSCRGEAAPHPLLVERDVCARPAAASGCPAPSLAPLLLRVLTPTRGPRQCSGSALQPPRPADVRVLRLPVGSAVSGVLVTKH